MLAAYILKHNFSQLNQPTKKMKKLTLEALNKSIAHWERLAGGNRNPGEGLGVDQCDLCKLFHSEDRLITCDGCPVKERTGQVWCVGTPYYHVVDSDSDYDTPEFMEAARLELEFLRSLLPKKEKQKKTKP